MSTQGRGALSRFIEADGFLLSAGLAFFFLVSMIPILVLGVFMVGLVLSTEQAARLGDSRWRQVLGDHERVVRAEVGAAGGRVMKMIGDGSLSIFDGPARAIRCAERIIGGARELDLEIRAGLHTGECEILRDDIAGLAVHIAARVSANADAPNGFRGRDCRRDCLPGIRARFSHYGRDAAG